MSTPHKKDKDALGKGIRSLLQSIDSDLKTTSGELKSSVVEAVTNMLRVPLDQIETNPRQPRHDFDEQSLQEIMPRLLGDGGQRIDYRHIIWSLVQKPGAFRRYRYREELFPTLSFRRAYDALIALCERDADLHYLRVLHLAASTSESEVEAALCVLLEAKTTPTIEAVKDLCASTEERVAKEVLTNPVIEQYTYRIEE